MKPEQHYRVNWIEGMKVGKNNFIDSENALTHTINQSNQRLLTPINYGLYANYSKEESAIDVKISLDGQSAIEVVLNKCKAITLSGYVIDISATTKEYLNHSGFVLAQSHELKEADGEYYIVITVNPYKRIPIGNADPEEEPLRLPYVLPEYKINILPKSEVTNYEIGQYHLTIGKVVSSGGALIVDENFIPPCQSIQSHKELKQVYSELITVMNAIEGFSMRIIQKIYQKEQTNNLAEKALHLSKALLQFLSIAVAEFRTEGVYSPPSYMVNRMSSLARVIKNNLDLYVGTGKEEFLNYLTDWCDLNQGAFETVLTNMISVNYSHTDINASLDNVHNFAKVILKLFKKLSELEYIGARKKEGVFVKEETIVAPKNEKRGSILDL